MAKPVYHVLHNKESDLWEVHYIHATFRGVIQSVHSMHGAMEDAVKMAFELNEKLEKELKLKSENLSREGRKREMQDFFIHEAAKRWVDEYECDGNFIPSEYPAEEYVAAINDLVTKGFQRL